MPLAEEIVLGEIGRGSHGRRGYLVSPFPGVAFATCQLNLTEPWFVLGDLSPCRQVAFPSLNRVQVAGLEYEVVIFLP